MKGQRLYWAVSQPLRWLGMSIDEWGVMLIGFVPGIFLLNGQNGKFGLCCMIAGFFSCYLLKKFKKLHEYFLLKSYLLAKGVLPKPSKGYPKLIDIVGK
jgi:hypothetical protein